MLWDLVCAAVVVAAIIAVLVMIFGGARGAPVRRTILHPEELTSRLYSAESDAGMLGSRLTSLEERVGSPHGWDSIATRLEAIEERLDDQEDDLDARED